MRTFVWKSWLAAAMLAAVSGAAAAQGDGDGTRSEAQPAVAGDDAPAQAQPAPSRAGEEASVETQPAVPGAGENEPVKVFGLPLYPGAEPSPEVAQAVQAYYAPSVPANQRLEVAAYETPAAFQEVYDFYGPLMDPGKWGWRRKTRPLVHQTRTLTFYRSQLATASGDESGELPDALEPLFGDVEQSQEEFEERVSAFADRNAGVKIDIVEGARSVRGDPARSSVRVLVESPYVDLRRMEVVGRTRILLLKVSEID